MIYINNKEFTVQGYKKLLKISEDEIVFIIFNKTVVILGNELSITYFEKDEFVVKGIINNIQMYEN